MGKCRVSRTPDRARGLSAIEASGPFADGAFGASARTYRGPGLAIFARPGSRRKIEGVGALIAYTGEFRPFAPGIEVNGRSVYSVVESFSIARWLPGKILSECGIGELTADADLLIDPESWYSQDAWMQALSRIAREAGPRFLRRVGERIPENATFPTWVTDIYGAIRSIDIAYHMNHRRDGQVMFDPSTEAMLEGIGHYGYEPVPGENRILSECRNPYPCAFDEGIVFAMARRFESGAEVSHATDRCRSNGDLACTYVIEW